MFLLEQHCARIVGFVKFNDEYVYACTRCEPFGDGKPSIDANPLGETAGAVRGDWLWHVRGRNVTTNSTW